MESSDDDNPYDSDQDFMGDLEEVELNPDPEIDEDEEEDPLEPQW
jgi:hypothetical protein